MTNYRLGMFDENAYVHGMDVVKDMHNATGKMRADTHFVVIAVCADGYLQFAGADATLNIPIDRLMTKQVAQMILGRMESHGEIDIEESSAKSAVDIKFELCHDIEKVLKIGRDFQKQDSWRGAHHDTAKLLCDTIENLRDRLNALAGNMAAMRETLFKCRELAETIWRSEGGEDVSSEIVELKDRIDAALAETKEGGAS